MLALLQASGSKLSAHSSEAELWLNRLSGCCVLHRQRVTPLPTPQPPTQALKKRKPCWRARQPLRWCLTLKTWTALQQPSAPRLLVRPIQTSCCTCIESTHHSACSFKAGLCKAACDALVSFAQSMRRIAPAFIRSAKHTTVPGTVWLMRPLHDGGPPHLLK